MNDAGWLFLSKMKKEDKKDNEWLKHLWQARVLLSVGLVLQHALKQKHVQERLASGNELGKPLCRLA
jgi:hypothetical protein